MSPIIEQQHQGPPVYTYDVRLSDVRLGRGRDCAACIGTIAFKALLESRIASYTNKKSTYGDKKRLCTDVVETVHEAGGRFLLKGTVMMTRHQGGDSDTALWEVLDRTTAQTKIRECFRDCAKRKNPSLLLVKAGISGKFTTQQTYAEILIQVDKCQEVHSFLQSQISTTTTTTTTTKTPSLSISSPSPATVVDSLTKSLLLSQGLLALENKEKIPSFSSPELLPKKALEWGQAPVHNTADLSPGFTNVPPPSAQSLRNTLPPLVVKNKTTCPPPEPPVSNFLDGMMFVWSNLESLDDFLGRRSNEKSTTPPSQIETTHKNTPRTDTTQEDSSQVVVSTTTTTTTVPLPLEEEEEEADHSQNCFFELDEILNLRNPPELLLQDDSMSCFSSLCCSTTEEDLSAEGCCWTKDDDVVAVGQVAEV